MELREKIYDFIINEAKLKKWYPVKNKDTMKAISEIKQELNEAGLVVIFDIYQHNLKVDDYENLRPFVMSVRMAIEKITDVRKNTADPYGATLDDVVSVLDYEKELVNSCLWALLQQGKIIAKENINGIKYYYLNKGNRENE